jgi:hypothetical protein
MERTGYSAAAKRIATSAVIYHAVKTFSITKKDITQIICRILRITSDETAVAFFINNASDIAQIK